MKDQIIEFETAKLAKEKGFDVLPTSGMYMCMGEHTGFIGASVDCFKYIAAPTQSLLQKWLREKYCVDSLVVPALKECHYEPLIITDNDNQIMASECFVTYEEALEAGLIEALKLIKI